MKGKMRMQIKKKVKVKTTAASNETNVVNHMDIVFEDSNNFRYEIHVNRRGVSNVEEFLMIARPAKGFIVPLMAYVEFEDTERILDSRHIEHLGGGVFDVKEKTHYDCHVIIDLVMSPHNVETYITCMKRDSRGLLACLVAQISDGMRADATAKGLNDRPSVVLDFTYAQILDKNSDFDITFTDHTLIS